MSKCASEKIQHRAQLLNTKRWVVKIGSALLTANGRGLDRVAMSGWVAQIVRLKKLGIDPIIVSSGAVAEGMSRLGMVARPTAIHDLQAAAAVGQMGLVQAWETCFQQHGLHTAQILVTHDDLSDRKRYLNSRSALLALLELGVVPVVNENDTVVTDEIRFGDNDTLGALVANLVEADLLVILTDQKGMFDSDPRSNPDAALISEGRASDESLVGMASGASGQLGRGGMSTKVRAAQLAARSGAATVIAGGAEPDVIGRIYQGEPVGTFLVSDEAPWAARKQWLAGHLQMKGILTLDDGAVNAIKTRGVSLLPVGVTSVSGAFKRGEMVACVNSRNERIACGLINYSAKETQKIKGVGSDVMGALLGYLDEPELIHRDNMVVF